MKEFDHGFVVTDDIQDDAFVVQEPDVLGTTNDAVHEKDVSTDLVPDPSMEPLESHEVQKQGLGSVVHHDGWEPQHPALEGDFCEALGFAFLEPDSGFVDLHCGPDDHAALNVFIPHIAG